MSKEKKLRFSGRAGRAVEMNPVTLKRYLYVIAEAPRNDLSMVSFAHTIVLAQDESHAYRYGQKHFSGRPNIRSDRAYRFLNDYVVEVDEGRLECRS